MAHQEATQILRQKFGYGSFRPHQQEVIDAVTSGKDCLVIMPTGGGKSITYQIPALMQQGAALVISPLIALMKDQVESLKASGVHAGFLNSSQSADEQQAVQQQVEDGSLKLLYVSPEKALSGQVVHLLRRASVSLFAIDEAHCISAWGHDFRPEYKQLGHLKRQFPGVPVMALTATADKITRRDIIAQLQLKKPQVFISSFDRPNLNLQVRQGRNKLPQIVRFIREKGNGPGIIYCLSRKATEQVADKLQQQGINAAYYHAGLEPALRASVHEKFMRDDVQVVCATIAFGMGIDKSNIRWIIHYNMPKNMESYYQEIGRAGRDDMPAETILFYSYRDIMVYTDFINNGSNTNAEVELAKLNRMREYAESYTCRRKTLLSYFGENMEEDCGNCDVCKNPPATFDGTIIAQKALSAVFRTREQVGINTLIDVLRGSARKDIYEKNLNQIKTYGAGKDVSTRDWQEYVIQLMNQGLLEIAYDQNHVLKLTPASKQVLFDNKAIRLVKPVKSAKQEKAPAGPKLSQKEQLQHELFGRLQEVRKSLADASGVAPYKIFSDASLQDMARQQPVSSEGMRNITGMGDYKLKHFARSFADAIGEFLNEKTSQGKQIKRATQKVTLRYFRQGLSPEEIAEKREIKPNTIYSHLATLLEDGKQINVSRLLTGEELDALYEVIGREGPEQPMRALYEALDESMDYGKIKLGIALYKQNHQE